MTDKPAATGSGEPLLPDQRCCACGKRYQEHAGRDNLCYTDGRTLTFVPTPPASQPTVTLAWETKRLIAAADDLLTGGKFEGCDLTNTAYAAIAELRRALALLRAAEQR